MGENKKAVILVVFLISLAYFLCFNGEIQRKTVKVKEDEIKLNPIESNKVTVEFQEKELPKAENVKVHYKLNENYSGKYFDFKFLTEEEQDRISWGEEVYLLKEREGNGKTSYSGMFNSTAENLRKGYYLLVSASSYDYTRKIKCDIEASWDKWVPNSEIYLNFPKLTFLIFVIGLIATIPISLWFRK